MSHHTKLDEKLEGVDNFRAWNYKISLVLEVFNKFKEFKALIENHTEKKIKTFRSDNG